MDPEGFAKLDGHKIQINWYRDNQVGLTYLEGPMEGGSKVVDESDVDWVWGKPKPAREKFSLADLGTDELRERLKKVRRERRNLMQNREQASSTQRGTRTSKRRRKTVSKKQVQEQMKNLSDEEKRMLKELMGEE